MISCELVLTSDQTFYSFLGGTRPEAFQSRPNELLKDSVCDVGCEEGKEWYVLGGGVAPGDGFFRYKLAFSPGGAVPFYTWQGVGDPERYSAAVTSSRVSDDCFFPAYRAQRTDR